MIYYLFTVENVLRATLPCQDRRGGAWDDFLCLRFDSPPKTKHFVLSALSVRWIVHIQISVREFLQAFSRPWLAITPLSLSQEGPKLGNHGAGCTPVPKADPTVNCPPTVTKLWPPAFLAIDHKGVGLQ